MPINFPNEYKNKIYQVGNILRKEIINYSATEKNYNNKDFSILILGGSQGSTPFNLHFQKHLEKYQFLKPSRIPEPDP